MRTITLLVFKTGRNQAFLLNKNNEIEKAEEY